MNDTTNRARSQHVSGIYLIRNSVTGKVYVGQSVKVSARLVEHKRQLRRNEHHNPHLQAAYNLYGDVFETEVIEFCPRSELNEREIHWISEHNATDPDTGYNILNGGDNVYTADIEIRKKWAYKKRDLDLETVGAVKEALAFEFARSLRSIADEFDVPYHAVKSIAFGNNYYIVRDDLNTLIAARNEHAEKRRIRQVRRLWRTGATAGEIGERLGTTGKSIKQYARDYCEPSDTRCRVNKINRDYRQQHRAVHTLAKAGYSNLEISDMLGLDKSVVSKLKNQLKPKQISSTQSLSRRPAVNWKHRT